MTLPERVLALLAEIDPDRAQAVVKITEAVAGNKETRFRPVELVEMGSGQALIVVGPNRALKKIPGLKLIEIARTRYLLALPTGTPVEALEVALRDLTNDPEVRGSDHEQTIVQELLNVLGQQRRSRRMFKAEILIINTV